MRDGRRTERRVLIVVALVLAFGLHRFAILHYDYGMAAGELPRAVQDYRGAGLPWTAADLRTGGVPTSQNAAPLIQKAIAAWPGDVPYDAYRNGTVGPLLPGYARPLTLAHAAAQRPHLDFARDWDLGPSLLFPESARIKAMARLLAARAELRAKAGDDAGALTDLEDARRLAVLVGQEPDVIAALVSDACHRYALLSARVCLVRAVANPSRLTVYQRWLAMRTPLPDEHRALQGGAYMILANVRNMDLEGIGEGLLPMSDYAYSNLRPPRTIRRDGTPGNTRTQAYMARCLQMWTELARKTHGLTDPVDEIGPHAVAIGERHEREHRLSHMFDAILLPAFTHFGDGNRNVGASRNVDLAFADALLLHARTGRWPIVTAYADPFGRGPLKVRRDAKGLRVWSVGRNRADDGGLTADEAYRAHRKSDDEVAKFP